MKRDELLSRLQGLLPAQFEEVLFHLPIPSSQLSGVTAPQATRAIELLRHLENIGELPRLERLLSFYDGVAGARVVAVPASAARPPVPVYPDAEVEALSKRLDAARARRDKLRGAGIDASDVEREILELRRQLREGGRLRPGDSLRDGRYLLVRVVGRGGFAVVWEAYDSAAKQRIAIKVLHANLAGDPQRRERFFRGAQAMMKLAHPGVVRVLDPEGEDGGFYYFVMEFVPGSNLRDAVLERRVTPDDVLPVILQVGDALALAHSRGMVHRDIKPANILLDECGNAKLTDFDLVGAHDTTGGTRTGALGTVVYAAPECLDRPQDATTRADVYGLGMTAIFGLGGRELSIDMFRNPERTIATIDCSTRIRNALRRAVAWDPDDRFGDAAAMVMELRAALDREGQVAPMVNASSHDPTAYPLLEAGEAIPTRIIRDESTGQRPAAARREVRLAAWLVFAAGEVIAEARWFALDMHAIAIGRTVTDGIAVPADRGMSKLHATIHTGAAGRFAVVDERSSNGTAVNGRRVANCVLKTGDVISCGESCLVIGEVPVDEPDPAIDSLWGEAAAMRRLRHTIVRLAGLPSTVLIQAETGCGKELVARALHSRASLRGDFVSVNCGAIPSELAEGILFGQVAGAYSGGSAQRGAFGSADQGTLFLDEIDELSLQIQPKLLRAIQERAVHPIGATRPVPCTTRVVAATNRSLTGFDRGLPFRGDLYARLREFCITIPPVRERREDILRIFSKAIQARRITPPLAQALLLYRWPYNVRELFAVARDLCAMSHSSEPLDAPLFLERINGTNDGAVPEARQATGAGVPFEAASPDRAELEQLLREHRGVVAKVAQTLGRSRRQVYRWIERYKIDIAAFR